MYYYSINVVSLSYLPSIIGKLFLSKSLSGILAGHLSVYATTIRTTNPPGSTFTYISSINDNGEVAGFYTNNLNQETGFTELNGTITTINPPGSTNTEIKSINDNGEVAGYYENSSNQYFGFTELNGIITKINPLGFISTFINSINDNGEVAGSYRDSSNQTIGFTDLNGTITTINPPGSINTQINSINNNGEVAGFYTNSLSSESIGFIATSVPEPLNILGATTGLVLFGTVSTALKRRKLIK